MIVRLAVILGVAFYAFKHGYLLAAAFVLLGGFPYRPIAFIVGLPYNPFGWGFLVIGSALLALRGEWIVAALPLLWAFVWEIWGPKLFGMKSIPEELRERNALIEAASNAESATFMRLRRRFGPYMDNDDSTSLASALCDELFDREPKDAKAITFRRDNSELVESELGKVRDDATLCAVVIQTFRVLASIRYTEGESDVGRLSRHFMKLDALGIIGTNTEAPVVSTFVPLVRSYCAESLDENRGGKERERCQGQFP